MNRITKCEELAGYILRRIGFCENSHNSPAYIVLDKKTYKLFLKTSKAFTPAFKAGRLFGTKILLVKSKEQIIVVGY